MVRHLNVPLEDAEFRHLERAKELAAKEQGKDGISWDEFVLEQLVPAWIEQIPQRKAALSRRA